MSETNSLLNEFPQENNQVSTDFPENLPNQAEEGSSLNEEQSADITTTNSTLENCVDDTQPVQKSRQNWWQAALSGVGNAAGAVSTTTGQAAQGVASATANATMGTVNFVGQGAVASGQAVAGATVAATGAVANAAVQGGRIVTEATVNTASFVGNAAVQTGQAVAGGTVSAATAAGSAAMNITDGLGNMMELVGDSSQLQGLADKLQIGWLLPVVEQVDVVKAEQQVRKLLQKYPTETSRQIAHRIMMEKVVYVGGSGLATSLVPGFAAGMFAVDLAATTAIQAEMGYQIAGAYGLDLHAPARKGEILAIFGLAFGSSYAIKSGLQLAARNVPVAGAVVGAGTNAASLYAVGHMACLFYEGKTGASTQEKTSPQAESQTCYEEIFQQQLVMDQILIHLFMAGDAARTWENTLPVLEKRLKLSPTSVSILTKLPKLPALESLLADINADFAPPLLAQCQKIAHEDGILTPAEAHILTLITQQLQPDNSPPNSVIFSISLTLAKLKHQAQRPNLPTKHSTPIH
ncbi:MAG: hypothetical protein AAFV72_07365 [Cyanobacteria bacterium J06635_1]